MAGAMRFSLTCPRCEGSGRLANTLHDVPWRRPHFDTRRPSRCAFRRARSKGRGCASRARATPERIGAPAGDLYITVRVEAHPFFRRDGDDIEITVPVRIDEAGLGTKIEVPTIDGRALLKIPQGTKNGQKFRLREKGVLNSRTGDARRSDRRDRHRSAGGAGRAHQGTAARIRDAQSRRSARGDLEQGVMAKGETRKRPS